MKHTTSLRYAIAGLSLAIASSVAMAQNPGSDAVRKAAPQQHCMKAGHHHGKHFGHRMPGQFRIPADLMAKLDLTDAQKVKYFDAEAKTKATFKELRAEAKRSRQQLRESGKPNFDPKAMFERQNERFEKFQAARKTIQTQWLGFWDSLTDAQKDTVQKYMQEKFNKHARNNPDKSRG